jgi:multidrug transporter EmrE-like cation transporter
LHTASTVESACRGTVGAALVGVLVLSEPLPALRALGIALIVGGVVVFGLAGVD